MIDLLKKNKEIVLYIVFGGLTTVVNWVTYSLFVSFCSITVANVIAWVFAVVFAYLTNKIFVFEQKSWKPNIAFFEFSKFVSSRLLTGVVEIAGVDILVYVGLNQTIFGIEGMVAKVTVSIVVVILNYFFSKLIVFKEKNKTVSDLFL